MMFLPDKSIGILLESTFRLNLFVNVMRTGAILQASFHEKDTVKALGAQWHPMLKKWFLPENGDLSIFSKWLPEQTGGGPVFAFTPIYLVKSSTDICQRCGEKAAVFCLASDGFVADGYFHENFKYSRMLESIFPGKLPHTLH